MKTVCKKDMCAGCMACLEVCPQNAISIKDEVKHYNAIIGDRCIDCGACYLICQNNHPAEMGKPQQWYQGWANDVSIRANGSSGGLAMSVASAFVKNGGTVCSCVFDDGEFTFQFANTIKDLKKFAGSKYVKSNPYGIYKKIKARLKQGEKILFIGLPCQVSALRNFIKGTLEIGLYTIDLICHGTPSPQILDVFLRQHGYDLKELKSVSFRKKDGFRFSGDYKSVASKGISDRYMISFLESLSYTENCYSCQYAQFYRVSDLTLGDSWGSNLPNSEWKKGISLVLCQTEKGKKLLKQADLHLEKVDLKTAIENNHQLEHPSVKPRKWKLFMDGVIMEKKVDGITFRCLPKKCIKQMTKRVLISLKIIQGGGVIYQINVKK